MTTEVMGSILEHINQAADRLSAEIQELRSELIREHVETVGGGCHGGIHRIESLGEEGKTLAQGSHPLVGIGRFGGLPKHGARLREIGSIAHILTSLLCVGLLILPLGRKALKRNTSGKQSALADA